MGHNCRGLSSTGTSKSKHTSHVIAVKHRKEMGMEKDTCWQNLGLGGHGGCFVLFQVGVVNVMAGSNLCEKAQRSSDNGESASAWAQRSATATEKRGALMQ